MIIIEELRRNKIAISTAYANGESKRKNVTLSARKYSPDSTFEAKLFPRTYRQ